MLPSPKKAVCSSRLVIRTPTSQPGSLLTHLKRRYGFLFIKSSEYDILVMSTIWMYKLTSRKPTTIVATIWLFQYI